MEEAYREHWLACNTVAGAHRAQILNWLAGNDHIIGQQRATAARRAPGTGQWLLESSEYQTWLSGERQTLFCTGIPGSGKSTLVSLVIKELLSAKRGEHDVKVAFYYCRSDRETRPEQIVRSILWELVSRLASVPQALVDLYQKYNTTRTQASFKDWGNVLETIICIYSKAYVVIDGLDELPSSCRRDLLDVLFRIQQTGQVNLLVTSRPLPEVKRRFLEVPSIAIHGSGFDITQYVASYMPRLPKFVQTNPGLQDEITETIVKNADGMFSYAHCALDALADQRTPWGVQQALKRREHGDLDDLYKKLMQQLDSLPEESKNLAVKTLTWLTMSNRPLEGRELQHALAIDQCSARMDSSKVPDLDDIAGLCGALVVHSSVHSTIDLIHYTALEYLLKRQDQWTPDAEGMMAKSCITYLALDEFAQGPCQSDQAFEARLQHFPFYRYATENWAYHLRLSSYLLEDDMRPFFMNEGKIASAVQAIRSNIGLKSTGYSQQRLSGFTGLHLAAHSGATQAIDLLMKHGVVADKLDSEGHSPLWHAVEQDHTDAILLLSKRDRITFSIMRAKNETARANKLLQCTTGHIRDAKRRTLLHIGVVDDDLELMERALEYGIGLDSKDGEGYTAMQLAFREKRPRAVKWLLRKTASTGDFTYAQWCQVFNPSGASVLELSEDSTGLLSVQFMKPDQVKPMLANDLHSTKRLLVFDSLSSWPMDVSRDPSSDGIEPMAYKVSFADEARRHSIIASVPRPSYREGDDGMTILNGPQEILRIAWTMKAPRGVDDGDAWVPHQYFSTLPVPSMPVTGAAFCKDLIRSVELLWLSLCDSIDGHLLQFRRVVLDANGNDNTVVSRLLIAANAWIDLRGQMHRQVQNMNKFCAEYADRGYENVALGDVYKAAKTLEKNIGARMDKLDQSTAVLIQLVYLPFGTPKLSCWAANNALGKIPTLLVRSLMSSKEFNLTSIREAQKSTTLNRSIKRLTWITFVFLPLTFVSGLFGMNVNILQANPSWWWYLVFAGSTLGLTFVVWLVFKKYNNLEDQLEKSFAWLIGSHRRNKGNVDVELARGCKECKKID